MVHLLAMTDAGKGALVVAILGVSCVLAVGLQIWNSQSAKARRIRAMRELASSLGCRFEAGPVRAGGAPYHSFECFVRGQDRRASCTISGVWKSGGRPYPVRMGDFVCSDQQEDTSAYWSFSYVLVRLPFPYVPGLRIRRTGVLDRVVRAAGLSPVRFESEEFNRAFVVRCADAKFASDVVSPAMMAFLLESGGFDLEIAEGQCCINGDEDRWAPDEFRERVRWVEGFLERWPAFLLEKLEAGGFEGEAEERHRGMDA